MPPGYIHQPRRCPGEIRFDKIETAKRIAALAVALLTFSAAAVRSAPLAPRRSGRRSTPARSHKSRFAKPRDFIDYHRQ